MSKFGWSLPAGCGRLPAEEPEPPPALRCPACRVLYPSIEPARTEPWEDHLIDEDTGQVVELLAAGWYNIYRCEECGEETKDPIWVDEEELEGEDSRWAD